jgi:hypothetical protein
MNSGRALLARPSVLKPELELEPIGGDARGAVALLGQCLISIGRQRLEPPQVEHIARGVQRLQARRRPFAFLAYREPGSDVRPHPEARARMTALTAGCANLLAAAALICPTPGFGGTIYRSVVTAITLAVGPRFPNRVFSDLTSAAAWLSAVVPADVPLQTEALILGVEALRSWPAEGARTGSRGG